MKNVQITQELFWAIIKYHLAGQEQYLPDIKEGLEKNLDSLVMREIYTRSKTALTEEEREKARKEYLDRRGIGEDFGW